MIIEVIEYRTIHFTVRVEAESLEAYEEGDYEHIEEYEGDCIDTHEESATIIQD